MGCGSSVPQPGLDPALKPSEKPPTPNKPAGPAPPNAAIMAAQAQAAAAHGTSHGGRGVKSLEKQPSKHLDKLTPRAASILASPPNKKSFKSDGASALITESKVPATAAESNPAAAGKVAGPAGPRASASSPSPVPDILRPHPNAPVDVTLRGVSLRFLQHMVASGAVDATLSMREVVESYVQPRTDPHKCCLFDLIPTESTGKPRYFVSYASSHRLGELLRLLQDHLEGEQQAGGDVMVWLEVMAVKPHEGMASLLDGGDLDRLLMDTEKLLFCLDDRCGALSDVWCLFEAMQAFVTKGPSGIVVLMPMIDDKPLRDAFKALNIAKASAPNPGDAERVLSLMGGAEAAPYLNGQIREALVGSALHEAEHTTLEGAPWAVVLNKASELSLADARFVEAEIMGRQALQTRQQVLGPKHPQTLRSTINLAAVLTERGRMGEAGRHAEAEGLYRQILEVKTAALSEDHPETVNWLNKLASCVDAQGRRLDAEPLYRQVLSKRTRLLGEDHPDTLAAMGHLATCIKSLSAEEDGAQRVAMAEAMYRQALEAYTRVLGPEHPDTIHAYNNLAICIDDQGRRDEAEPMFFKVLEQRTRLLGEEHPTTADAMYNLGGLLEAEGEYDEALRMYESARDVYLRNYGPDHPETEDAGSRALAMKELIGYERSSLAGRASG